MFAFEKWHYYFQFYFKEKMNADIFVVNFSMT